MSSQNNKIINFILFVSLIYLSSTKNLKLSSTAPKLPTFEIAKTLKDCSNQNVSIGYKQGARYLSQIPMTFDLQCRNQTTGLRVPPYRLSINNCVFKDGIIKVGKNFYKECILNSYDNTIMKLTCRNIADSSLHLLDIDVKNYFKLNSKVEPVCA